MEEAMESNQLTRCEAEVMDVVWARESVTVQDVVDSIQRDLAYTTVMTTLKILEQKGFVRRGRKRGRAYLYSPLVSRESVSCSMARELTDRLFGGSLKSLVLSLVQTSDIASDDLAELRSAIETVESLP
jgi:predicted transcriptional regulator